MTNRFLSSFIIFMACFSGCAAFTESAYAQRCDVTEELIFTFNETRAGAFSIWDNVYGEQSDDERFIGVIPEGREAVVLGERYKKDGDELQEVVFVRFDKRGRATHETQFKEPHLKSVTHFKAIDAGYLVIGRHKAPKKADAVWLAILDNKGQVIDNYLLNDPDGALYVHDIVQKTEGDGYVAAASLAPVRGAAGKERFSVGSEVQHAMLYHLDKGFKITKKMAYLPGINGRIKSLVTLDGGGFAAVGYTTNQSGREVGWVVRLGGEGQIVWQREYARGARAHFTDIGRFLGDGLVLGGVAHPVSGIGGNKAGWVALIDMNRGDVQWQRYYRGDLSHEVRDISVQNDKTILVLMNAIPSAENSQKFSRVLRLNRRGFLLGMDAYFNGEGTRAEQMILGPRGERFLAGSTNMRYIIEGKNSEEDVISRSLDGWVSVGAIQKPYNDPCD